jgi:hypothetical protein
MHLAYRLALGGFVVHRHKLFRDCDSYSTVAVSSEYQRSGASNLRLRLNRVLLLPFVTADVDENRRFH